MEDRPEDSSRPASAPFLSSSIVPSSHSQQNACDLQKRKKIDRESWLVLPLLSCRGNVHIVHPKCNCGMNSLASLGLTTVAKMSSEVVTGFYRRYFVLCKVFLLEKMCIFCFQNCCLWNLLALRCAACNVHFNSLPSQKIWSTLAKVSSEAVKPGH